MFMMSLLWAAVQQVLVLRSCSGDAVGACVAWGSLEISRRERCTACLVTKACLRVTCQPGVDLELEQYTTITSRGDRVTDITPTGNQFLSCVRGWLYSEGAQGPAHDGRYR
jgi:hypothetical protein